MASQSRSFCKMDKCCIRRRFSHMLCLEIHRSANTTPSNPEIGLAGDVGCCISTAVRRRELHVELTAKKCSHLPTVPYLPQPPLKTFCCPPTRQIPRPIVSKEVTTYRTCTPPSVETPPAPTSNYVAIDEVGRGNELLCRCST